MNVETCFGVAFLVGLAVGIVLVLVCVNVAVLMLLRALRRRQGEFP